jgi:hypothetical protein
MTRQRQLRLVHEGDFVAEVEVDLEQTAEGWGPYLSLADARKLGDVRRALRRGDLAEAAKIGAVYRLTPVRVA